MKPVLKTKREIYEVLVRTGSRAVRTKSAESCLQVFGAILKLLNFWSGRFWFLVRTVLAFGPDGGQVGPNGPHGKNERFCVF